MRRTLFSVFFVLAASVALVFLALPILAIFAHTSPAKLLEQLSNPVVKSTKSRSDAVAFINKVLSPAGQAKLRAAGFLPVKGTPTTYTGG